MQAPRKVRAHASGCFRGGGAAEPVPPLDVVQQKPEALAAHPTDGTAVFQRRHTVRSRWRTRGLYKQPEVAMAPPVSRAKFESTLQTAIRLVCRNGSALTSERGVADQGGAFPWDMARREVVHPLQAELR